MMVIKPALRLACLLPLFFFSGQEARAVTCDPTDNDFLAANRVITAVSADIAQMEAAVVYALQLQTGQLSGYIAQNSKAITEALDAQTKLQAQIAREVEETEAIRDYRPGAAHCKTVTGLTGLAGSRAASAEALTAAIETENARLVGDLSRVTAQGRAADSTTRLGVITNTFCNADRAGEGGSGCAGEAALHAADVDPGRLFDRATFADQAEQRVAIELSRNLAAPVVEDPPALMAAETQEERERILRHRAADTRVALASDYFSRARAMRAPAVNLGAWAAAVLPEGARDPQQAVSRHELLELLTSRRFDDPNWFVSLQQESSSNLLRELVTLQAISLLLQWEQYRLDERRGAVGAAGLAIAAEEARRLPGLGNPAYGTN